MAIPSANESFWGEIAPCDHFVQIYDDAEVFLEGLEGFVSGGLKANEGVLVIAVPSHLSILNRRLTAAGFDLDRARARDQYIDLDAQEALGKFMRGGWPDEQLLAWLVTDLLRRAGKGGRRVRAFGEMVAILWENGHAGATVRLEHLWHRLCQKDGFALFCAYPKAGFTRDAEASIQEICQAHSRVVGPGPALPN